eukprot:6576863-Alexandrium_andersonii.AAC.1
MERGRTSHPIALSQRATLRMARSSIACSTGLRRYPEQAAYRTTGRQSPRIRPRPAGISLLAASQRAARAPQASA